MGQQATAVAKTSDRRIVLLGLPGGGKSSSGNTILGSERFSPAPGFNPGTTETVCESATVEGRHITVVDTPGFTDEDLTPEQLFQAITQSILMASPGPHAFVIVVRIGRITASDKRLFELLPQLFGSEVSDARPYSMVLFTNGDKLNGQSMNDLIQSNRHVSELVSMCGGRYCVFNNTDQNDRQQVRNLLNKIDEMVTNNGGQHFTNDMFRMAETIIREERSRQTESGSADDRAFARFYAWLEPSLFPEFLFVLGVIAAGLVGAAAGAAVVVAVGATVVAAVRAGERV